jgi:hypothetical protein
MYNEKMANTMMRCGYTKEYAIYMLRVMNKHFVVEAPYEKCYFQELNWKITVPETNPKN